MVEEAQGSKVPIQAFADKVTAVFVPVVIGVALLTLAAWLLFPGLFGSIAVWASGFLPWVNPNMGDVALALFSAIAVLVIACPCALGLATPTALMVGSGMGAENGVLIRKGAAIQRMKDVTSMVLDKTGTITEGKPGVTDIVASNGYSDKDLLYYAGSAESGSEHPLGKAVTSSAKEAAGNLARLESFTAVSGHGIEAVVDGKTVVVGTKPFVEGGSAQGGTQSTEEEHYAQGGTRSNGKGLSADVGTLSTEERVSSEGEHARAAGGSVGIPEELLEKQRELEHQAKTVMFVVVDGKTAGVIAVADRVKSDSVDAIAEIKKYGIVPVMLTGDNERTAKAIAAQVGISDVIPQVLPDQKVEEIKKLQQRGEIVAMAGDGINDAPALTQADIGIAIGTGTDVAIEAGDIVLVKGDLTSVVKAVKLSIATFKKIKQNLFWAFFYNVVMVPLAVMGMMHPVLAEIAMAFSSINVVTNSRRLQKANIGPAYGQRHEEARLQEQMAGRV
jgi:Cu+-exporting ATPase